MKVTAGHLRGRKVPVPNIEGLRPTPSKVRQALFNILGDIEGAQVLDLYAGSGVMALEALSRGAASAVSIERHAKAVRAMQQLQQTLAPNDWRILAISVEQGLKHLADRQFDLIFADPPYAQGLAEKLPLWLDEQHIGCDRLVIEESSKYQPHWPAGWQCNQSRSYGDTCLHFLGRE